MLACLHRIYDLGGTAVVQRSAILCAGEWLPHQPTTVLMLVGEELLAVTAGGRITITEKGVQLCKTTHNPNSARAP